MQIGKTGTGFTEDENRTEREPAIVMSLSVKETKKTQQWREAGRKGGGREEGVVRTVSREVIENRRRAFIH
jgi:hypothetical protein